MSFLNLETGKDTLDALITSIDGNIKIDPYSAAIFRAIKAGADALEKDLTKTATAKDDDVDLEESTNYIRLTHEFDTEELTQAVAFIAENTHLYSSLGIEARGKPGLVTYINSLCVLGEHVVNHGIVVPAEVPHPNATIEKITEFFESISVNNAFVQKFLAPHGCSLILTPLFPEDSKDNWFAKIKFPVLQVTRDGTTADVNIAPSESYTPDWYLFYSNFRVALAELILDAQIELEEQENLSVIGAIERESKPVKYSSKTTQVIASYEAAHNRKKERRIKRKKRKNRMKRKG